MKWLRANAFKGDTLGFVLKAYLLFRDLNDGLYLKMVPFLKSKVKYSSGGDGFLHAL